MLVPIRVHVSCLSMYATYCLYPPVMYMRPPCSTEECAALSKRFQFAALLPVKLTLLQVKLDIVRVARCYGRSCCLASGLGSPLK